MCTGRSIPAVSPFQRHTIKYAISIHKNKIGLTSISVSPETKSRPPIHELCANLAAEKGIRGAQKLVRSVTPCSLPP
jgi:hypothetical protein